MMATRETLGQTTDTTLLTRTEELELVDYGIDDEPTTVRDSDDHETSTKTAPSMNDSPLKTNKTPENSQNDDKVSVKETFQKQLTEDEKDNDVATTIVARTESKRAKRMMGLVLGTLARCKRDLEDASISESARKREQLDEKVLEKKRLEREQDERQAEEDRRARQMLREEYEALQMAFLQKNEPRLTSWWREQQLLRRPFLRTRHAALPALYYHPKILTDQQQQLLDQTLATEPKPQLESKPQPSSEPYLESESKLESIVAKDMDQTMDTASDQPTDPQMPSLTDIVVDAVLDLETDGLKDSIGDMTSPEMTPLMPLEPAANSTEPNMETDPNPNPPNQ